jgi:hypothetical protein
MEERCSIFLVSYGIFTEGNDVARLNMGVELSPRVDQRQAHGRVIRKNDGPESEWYTVTDDILVVGDGSFTKSYRITELLKNAVNRRKRFIEKGAKIVQVKNVLKKFSS